MKEFEHMPPPAGAKSAKRTGLGRWSAGNRASTWRFSTAPLAAPVFFPLRSAFANPETNAVEPQDTVQLNLCL
jgi:hypothetical protein